MGLGKTRFIASILAIFAVSCSEPKEQKKDVSHLMEQPSELIYVTFEYLNQIRSTCGGVLEGMPDDTDYKIWNVWPSSTESEGGLRLITRLDVQVLGYKSCWEYEMEFDKKGQLKNCKFLDSFRPVFPDSACNRGG